MITIFKYLGRIGEIIAIIKEFIKLWGDIKLFLEEQNLTASNSEKTEINSKAINLITRGDELRFKAKCLL